jgi:glucose/arabinose dehydrogenase
MSIRSSRRTIVLAATTTAIAVTPFLSTAAAAHPAHSVSITQVLSGLAAPRGIAFDRQGSMYVAESGVAGAGAAGLTHTGKVSKYRWGRTTPSWSTQFDSLYATEDPTAPPDVLGPEGLSATSSECSNHGRHHHVHGQAQRRHHHHHGHRNACAVTMIMSESTPGIAAASGGTINAPQAGHLFRLDGATGAATNLADVGTQMWNFTSAHTDLFPSDFPDSNPFGVLVTKDPHSGKTRTFVADAGANTISEVKRNGTARIIAYIPNETAAPFRDATPTCIAQGPDGFLYVGTLHLVANLSSPDGNLSDVWRVNPNANFPRRPKLWTSGLTTVTSCTFDRSGNFWATEMFERGPAAPTPGDVVKIPFSHPSHHTRIGFGKLLLPGGIAQGPDGAMYVTVGSAAPGVSGGVMRIGK